MIRFDDTSTLDDASLLAMNADADDNGPLGTLYVRYMPLVYGVCLKYLRNGGEASDAVAAIFEEVIRKAPRYEIREFRTWLYSVAKNHCLTYLKNRGLGVENTDSIMEFAHLDTLLDAQDKEARLATLEECLKKLPEKQRQCIEEFYLNNRSYADIVAATRWQVGAVKSSIQNGRRNLKICVEKTELLAGR